MLTNEAMTRSEMLASVRENAHDNSKLSISRPARHNIRPSTYQGHGNLHAVIKNLYPTLSPALWSKIVERVELHAEKENNGRTPDTETIRALFRSMVSPTAMPPEKEKAVRIYPETYVQPTVTPESLNGPHGAMRAVK